MIIINQKNAYVYICIYTLIDIYINILRGISIQYIDIKCDRFLWKVRFHWQITQNHVNDANTVIHNSLYLHHLRDFERSATENELARKKVALDIYPLYPILVDYSISLGCFILVFIGRFLLFSNYLSLCFLWFVKSKLLLYILCILYH
jgi:hypothetical protein